MENCPKCKLPNTTMHWHYYTKLDKYVCVDCYGEKTEKQIKRIRNKHAKKNENN